MWADEILTRVFSRLKYDKGIQALIKKYPEFDLTTSAIVSRDTSFPTLLLQQLTTPETGQDLDNTTVNAVRAGFQIDVIDNTRDSKRAYEVMDTAMQVMKAMRFNISGMPVAQDTDNEKRLIARFQRVIGSGDEL